MTYGVVQSSRQVVTMETDSVGFSLSFFFFNTDAISGFVVYFNEPVIYILEVFLCLNHLLQHFKNNSNSTWLYQRWEESQYTCFCAWLCYGCVSLCVAASIQKKNSIMRMVCAQHLRRAPDLLTKKKILWWWFQDMKNESGPKNSD